MHVRGYLCMLVCVKFVWFGVIFSILFAGILLLCCAEKGWWAPSNRGNFAIPVHSPGRRNKVSKPTINYTYIYYHTLST